MTWFAPLKRLFSVLTLLTPHTPQKQDPSAPQQGYTLVELLVAMVLTLVVISVAWSGLISVQSMLKRSEARVARQAELNRAVDFMSNEIRMARAINQAGTVIANGTTVTLLDVATHGGVNPASLGDYGTLGLYLEMPTMSAPALCPVGSPNAGLPPPPPVDYDPVVYDIRPSPSGWLKPRMLARYGRVPSTDGTINPCSNPVSSDPMMDALSVVAKSIPPCTGVRSGDGGFYSCVVDNRQVSLFFQTDVDKAETRQVTSTVSSRLQPIAPLSSTGSIILEVGRNGNEADLSWTYTGSPSDIENYNVLREVKATKTKKPKGKVKQDKDAILGIAPGERICYQVEATLRTGGQAPLTSNQDCIVK